MAAGAQRHRTLRLHLLQQAAARIIDGSYGISLNCGEEIATARPLEMPEAPLCSACA